MENENQDFSQLKKLLSLKKHEQPPPGYFNKFSGNVIVRILAQRDGKRDSLDELEAEAPWLMRFWRMLEAKPIFGAAFGAAVCSLVLAGILAAEKPVAPQRIAAPIQQPADPLLATSPTVDQPLLIATNDSPPNLFDLIPSNRPVNANFQPFNP